MNGAYFIQLCNMGVDEGEPLTPTSSIYNDSIIQYITEPQGFTYIEKSGLIDVLGYNMGTSYNQLLKLEDGNWNDIAQGSYSNLDDEDRGTESAWYWNGQELDSMESYNEQRNSVYDNDKAITINEFMSKEDVIELMESL